MNEKESKIFYEEKKEESALEWVFGRSRIDLYMSKLSFVFNTENSKNFVLGVEIIYKDC